MNGNPNMIIKSFKHNGRVHRIWLENWRVPEAQLIDEHRKENMLVFVNSQTRIQEADGRQWVSKIPGVSFFIPGEWYNAIALIEDGTIRFYCNIASPPYLAGQVLTYIDYDLDVIVSPSGATQIVDREEFERHKIAYHYNQEVERKVEAGMKRLLERIKRGKPPFDRKAVLDYYELWKQEKSGG